MTVEPSSFKEKVLKIVSQIPVGKTRTYKEVAEKAGNSKAARAVGTILRANYSSNIPCHRVVKSDGSYGGYNRGGTKVKKQMLKKEATSVR